MTISVGLIGLGNAGRALLEALSSNHSIIVFDRDPGSLQDLPAGQFAPLVAESAAELAARADLIILSLPTPAASLSVAEDIRTAIRPQSILLETSTVRPEDVGALQTILAPADVRVVDAAIIGGVHNLAKGKGVFLVGTSEEEAGPVGTVLRPIADELFFLGGPGRGMRAKLAVNAVAHAVYVVLVEAGALAAAQDIPLSVFQRLMERESGLTRPLTHRFGERLRTHDFDGGMSTANARKDSALILETARSLGVPLFAIQAAHSVYEIGMKEGLGSLDYSSIGQLWEKWLGISFAEKASDP